MAITTYVELQTAIGDWLNRADLDQKIPDFIRLAESTLNDVLRSADMVTSSTAAITAGRATLPADALEIVYAQVASTEDEPLEQIAPQQLTMLRRTRTRDAANPRFFAIVGRQLVLTPTPAGSVSLDLDYYARLPGLTTSNTTNWLLTDAPHVYLYTSLLHATPFLMDDARYQVFQSTVSQQVMAAVKSQQTLSFDDIKTAGFSLTAPTDVAAQAASALGAVSNAANNA
jgi:hypothetical protein